MTNCKDRSLQFVSQPIPLPKQLHLPSGRYKKRAGKPPVRFLFQNVFRIFNEY